MCLPFIPCSFFFVYFAMLYWAFGAIALFCIFISEKGWEKPEECDRIPVPLIIILCFWFITVWPKFLYYRIGKMLQ